MVCPIMDLTEPTPIGRAPPQAPAPAPASAPKTCRRVASSAASPAGVAVPCASTRPSAPGALGSSPASAQARSTASTCPSDAGASSVDVRPSLAEPQPRITAYIRSPARSASASRLRTTMPTPSPMRMPSARRSKGRIRELGDNARSSEKTLQNVTSCARCTPPTIMVSARPATSSRTAVSTAIRDDAQAASSV